jgi:hypothetical protein
MYNRQDTDNIHIHQTMDVTYQGDMSYMLEPKWHPHLYYRFPADNPCKRFLQLCQNTFHDHKSNNLPIQYLDWSSQEGMPNKIEVRRHLGLVDMFLLGSMYMPLLQLYHYNFQQRTLNSSPIQYLDWLYQRCMTNNSHLCIVQCKVDMFLLDIL